MAKHLWGVSKPVAQAITGLNFPSNGDDDNDVRFTLSGANLLPAYPATYLWKVNNRQQAGYYTTFFWGPDGAFTSLGYYGFHLYPTTDPKHLSTSHKQEVSVAGVDITTDDNGHNTDAVYDTWTDKAAVVTASGSVLTLAFYWDLSDITKVITYAAGSGYPSSFPPTDPALIFGGAPWSPGNECLSGLLRGLQVYDQPLTTGNLTTLKACQYDSQVIAAGFDPWFLNMNPTPTDITDKSGNGRDPEWSTANRPTLWEG